MAQPITCDSCGAEGGVVMVTTLANGDTTALGPGCLPTWLRAMLDVLETEAPATAPDSAQEAPEAEESTPEPIPVSRPRKGPHRGTAPVRSGDQGEAEPLTAATADAG